MLQAQDPHLSEARGHLEQGDPAAAAKAAERSLKKGETSEAHYIIGHNHLVNDELDAAEDRFRRAIKLDERNADAVFELGLVLDDKGDHEKAKRQFRRYTELRPEDPKGMVQEAYVLLAHEDKPAKAKVLLDSCLVRHPENTVVLYYEAICCHELGDVAAAIAHLDKGMGLDAEDVDFPFLRGRWLCQEDRYAEAEPFLAKAKDLSPDGRYRRYWAWSRTMASTDTVSWHRVNGEIRLTTPWIRSIAAMDSLVRIPGGRYDPAVLLPRFLGDAPLALDELFLLYYAQSVADSYSPYGDPMDTELREPREQGKWEKVRDLTDDHLKDHPVCLDALSAHAQACRNLGEPCYDHATIGFELLMQAISASGSGDSFEDAILVMSVGDEYTYLAFNDLRMERQSLHNSGAYSYDVLDCRDADGKERKVYFNITCPFNSLSKAFRKEK